MSYPLMRHNILRQDLDAVIEHLQQEDPVLTNGPKIREFEQAWSQWLGVKYSVFVNSGSSANLLSMAALKLRHMEEGVFQGGEVIVPALTWVSDIASVIHCGFTPVFVDIDPFHLAMQSDKIITAITPKTRAVFLTHAQGFDGLDDSLLDQLKKRDIPLIEDVCESHGASHHQKKLGSYGWMSNFSFYYAHHMSTIEGGMISTNDEMLYQQLRILRSHGMLRESSDKNFHQSWLERFPELNPDFVFLWPGWNMRGTEIGGILGLSQLPRLDNMIRKRNENHLRFLERIDQHQYRVDFKLEGASNYAFNLILKQKDPELVERLCLNMRRHKIEFRRGSAGGGNQLRQPYLQNYITTQQWLNYPQTEHIHFYGFYLGNYPELSHSDIDTICTIINQS